VDWSNSKVLVAGGAGLIGSHMARTLLGKGAKVRVADDLSSGSLNNIKDIKGRIDFHKIDLREKKNCLKMTKGVDYVFQFAANMGGIGYITSVGADIMRDSVLINTNMLQSACENKVLLQFLGLRLSRVPPEGR